MAAAATKRLIDLIAIDLVVVVVGCCLAVAHIIIINTISIVAST